MKPLSADAGVITPDTALATADAATQSTLATLPVDYADQAILDVPLMQVPEDVDEPIFTLAQKITDETQAAGTLPTAGLSGLSGLTDGSVDAQDILSGVADDAATAFGDAQTSIDALVAPVLSNAQTVFDQAKSALSGATGGTTPASTSAATTTQSEDPVAALLSGLSLPELPGIESLFDPILSLLESFGTGLFDSIDPTSILSSSSAMIEQAMSLAQGGVKTVQQLWEGESSDAATTASQQAQTEGGETSQRGFDIAALTQQAAAVVQSGNAQLSSIATTFAAQAAALAPTIMLPPTQATLIGLATEHLGEAVTVVNVTRGQLAGHTAELSGVVQQIAAQSGLPSPEEALTAVSENIGEPLLTQAEEALTGTDDSTLAATTTSPGTTTTPGTTPSGLGTGGSTGSPGGTGGSLGALGVAGGPNGTGGSAGTPSSGTPKSAGVPGAAVPGTARGMTTGLGGLGGNTTAASTSGSNFMGGGSGAGAGAGQRGGTDEEHGRTVTPYQSRTGNDDLTGPLGESTPDVIGAVHEDEREADEDRF
ncbi:hypothetical protein ACFXK0_16305 [Nocardia sp. NPDC059177]|uniref:hypothetical protein n=1 Tax=Nocardia sp. NPDC059177 TaxID=3346759 RepID=UPI0036C62BE0